MKTVWIAHPIAGDVEGNVARVEKLVHHLLRSAPAVVPVVPYLTWLEVLDENRAEDRQLGMSKNKAFFRRGFLDELWICGDRSVGVSLEIQWAEDAGVPVMDMTEWSRNVLDGTLYLADVSIRGFVPSETGRLPLRKG